MNQILQHTFGQQRRDRRLFEATRRASDEGIGIGTGEKYDYARIRAELSGTHQAAGGELVSDLLSPLGQRPRQDDDGIDARQFQIDQPSRRVGGTLELEAGFAAAGVRRSANASIRYKPLAVRMAHAV